VTTREYCLTGILLLAALTAIPPHAASQSNRVSDGDRKALFLYNLMQFVSWPADAFKDPTEALRVQVIGHDPFDGSLDRFLADKTVDQRRIAVTHAAAPTITAFPHVAVVSAAEEPRLAGVLGAYCRAPVLTVSDLDHFANRGGVIGLVEGGVTDLIEDDRALHFAINRTAANEARLKVGVEFLHLAYPLFSAVSPCGTR
jgi:hypothetical protein